jgi:tetratricopeptide (TPR) repeat protein
MWDGLRSSARALGISERSGNEALWANAAVWHGQHLAFVGRLAEGLALQERAWAIADRLNHATLRFITTWVRGNWSWFLGDPREALRWYQRFLSAAHRTQAPIQRVTIAGGSIIAHVLAGEMEAARRLLDTVDGDIERADAYLLLRAGQEARAEALLHQKREQARRSGDRWSEMDCDGLLAQVAQTRGEIEPAERFFNDALAIAAHGPALCWEIDYRTRLAVLYSDTNQVAAARPHVERCRAILAEGEDWRGLAGRVALAEAAVADAEGRVAEAAHYAETAGATFRRYSLPWDEADACIIRGKALRALGDDTGAAGQFDAARSIYRHIGADRLWRDRVPS